LPAFFGFELEIHLHLTDPIGWHDLMVIFFETGGRLSALKMGTV
jgi:hypothetical protein